MCLFQIHREYVTIKIFENIRQSFYFIYLNILNILVAWKNLAYGTFSAFSYCGVLLPVKRILAKSKSYQEVVARQSYFRPSQHGILTGPIQYRQYFYRRA